VFEFMYNFIRNSLNEAVRELLSEIPDLSKEDQAIIMKAIDGGIIPDKLPSYNDIMAELTALPDAKRVEPGDLKLDEPMPFADKADIHALYIKKILLPIAQGKRPLLAPKGKSFAKLGYDERDGLNDFMLEIVGHYFEDVQKEV